MWKRSLAVCLGVGLAAAALSCGSSPTASIPGTATLITLIRDSGSCNVLNLRATITDIELITPDGAFHSLYSLTGQPVLPVSFGDLQDSSTLLNVTTNVPPGTYAQAQITFSQGLIAVYDSTQTTLVRTVNGNLANTRPVVNITPNLTIQSGQTNTIQIDMNLRQTIQLDGQGNPTGGLDPAFTVTPLPAASILPGITTSVATTHSDGTVTLGEPTNTPTATSGFGYGLLDDMIGFISRVDTFSSSTSFSGDLALQLLPNVSGVGAGPAPLINLNQNSLVCAAATSSNQACLPFNTSPPGNNPSLSSPCASSSSALYPPKPCLAQIALPSYAEVSAYIDTSGTLIANSADIEDVEDLDTGNKLALVGTIVSLITDTTGNLTGFNLYIRSEEPDFESGVALDSVVTVNLASSTIYQYVPRSLNFTGNFASCPDPPDPTEEAGDSASSDLTCLDPTPFFGPSTLTPGQELVVHGVFTAPPSGTTGLLATVAPDSIYLRSQPHLGNFASVIQASADDKTGAFLFTPCCGVFGGQSVIVLTNSQDAVINNIQTAPPPSSKDVSATTVLANVAQTQFINVGGLSGLSRQSSVLVRGLLFRQAQATVLNGINIPAGSLVMLAQKVHQY